MKRNELGRIIEEKLRDRDNWNDGDNEHLIYDAIDNLYKKNNTYNTIITEEALRETERLIEEKEKAREERQNKLMTDTFKENYKAELKKELPTLEDVNLELEKEMFTDYETAIDAIATEILKDKMEKEFRNHIFFWCKSEALRKMEIE